MSDNAQPIGGSFRDPAGRVFFREGAILRAVYPSGAADYEFVRDAGLHQRLAATGRLLPATEVDRTRLALAAPEACYVLQHPRLPFISHPYEWSFGALRSAALLQLEIHLEGLDCGVTLSDASAYNCQFRSAEPVFIDHLSFRRYRPGEYWNGYRQFCEQFLNPLLLQALLGLPFQPWYRGSLEGITAGQLVKLLRLRHKLNWRVFLHVVLQARAQVAAEIKRMPPRVTGRSLHPEAFRGLIRQLRSWVLHLHPLQPPRSVWGHYSQEHTYSDAEAGAKASFVRTAVGAASPAMLWDLGCNTGAYSQLALGSGAQLVIGFESDPLALETAFDLAKQKGLAFVPLYADLANPSPNQGWAQGERAGLVERAPADFILALAFVHHLAIARNIPLPDLIPWLVRLAPRGVVEFVDKSDPTVQKMLALREDIFRDYTIDHFEAQLGRHARITRTTRVSDSGRTLYAYER